ncbi:hypothetical protein SAMN05428947_107176 [Mucilaginibacter sp. OK283]|nr:hypothetical protein SAMN05428947_107176 [Mucilaginibacter sp. OK283]
MDFDITDSANHINISSNCIAQYMFVDFLLALMNSLSGPINLY